MTKRWFIVYCCWLLVVLIVAAVLWGRSCDAALVPLYCTLPNKHQEAKAIQTLKYPERIYVTSWIGKGCNTVATGGGPLVITRWELMQKTPGFLPKRYAGTSTAIIPGDSLKFMVTRGFTYYMVTYTKRASCPSNQVYIPTESEIPRDGY